MNKEQIIFRFVNTEFYGAMLEMVPHREFCDLSIVYYELDAEQKNAKIITHADNMDLSEQELFELAKINTRKHFMPHVGSLSELLEWLDEEIEFEGPKKLYFITNEQKHLGATSILYEDIMESVAETVGTDLYLIPSSEHEFLAVSVDIPMTLDEIQEMVHFININQLELQERLSNQVYHYDMTTKEITQATHSPYTRLDGGRPFWTRNVVEGFFQPEEDMEDAKEAEQEESRLRSQQPAEPTASGICGKIQQKKLWVDFWVRRICRESKYTKAPKTSDFIVGCR